jgi:hypothetical protein
VGSEVVASPAVHRGEGNIDLPQGPLAKGRCIKPGAGHVGEKVVAALSGYGSTPGAWMSSSRSA